jgi:hypothetical protein
MREMLCYLLGWIDQPKKKLPCSAINLLSKVTTHLLHMALKGAQMPELQEVYI